MASRGAPQCSELGRGQSNSGTDEVLVFSWIRVHSIDMMVSIIILKI